MSDLIVEMVLSVECILGKRSLAHDIAEAEKEVETLYTQYEQCKNTGEELCSKVESICHWLLNEMRYTNNEEERENLRKQGLCWVKRQLEWLKNDDNDRKAREMEMLAYRLRFNNV